MGRQRKHPGLRRYAVTYSLPLPLIKQLEQVSPETPTSYVVEAMLKKGLLHWFQTSGEIPE